MPAGALGTATTLRRVRDANGAPELGGACSARPAGNGLRSVAQTVRRER